MRTSALLLASCALAACWNSGPRAAKPDEHPPAAAPDAATRSRAEIVDEVLRNADAFAEEICACGDAACADAVKVRYRPWRTKLEQLLQGPPALDAEVADAFHGARDQFDICSANHVTTP